MSLDSRSSLGPFPDFLLSPSITISIPCQSYNSLKQNLRFFQHPEILELEFGSGNIDLVYGLSV